jgi:coenzyme F420 hydrogenase subunit beta
MFHPESFPSDSDAATGTAAVEVCPGRGYPVVALGESLFPDVLEVDIELGRWTGLWAARMAEDRLLVDASSGGVMTGIAAHLLAAGHVRGVAVTLLRYGNSGPRPEPIIARSLDELLLAQGSKYCPVPLLALLPELERSDGPFALVGTPCQIAALRLLQRVQPEWRERVPLCIGSFCGGFRDLRDTDALIRRSGFDPTRVTRFRYRGGGQPGSMLIEDGSGRSAILPYPDYARRTGFAKIARCRTCVDATAELADFACGDAWIPRFLESGKGWSILMTRSETAQAVVRELAKQGALALMTVSVEEVRKSQKDNLLSKKRRQGARRRLYASLGLAVPEFDGGYPESQGGLLSELKVHLSHSIFQTLERLGLYPAFARLIGRYR